MPVSDALRITTVDDGVAELELCRPELLNRVDATLHHELGRALLELSDTPAVRAVVLCATGRCFSAGGDTELMLRAAHDPEARLAQIDAGRRLFRQCADFPKPLVVALHGDVYGVGASIVLTADAIVSAPGVKISDPHVAMALVAGDGGCIAWPENMPLVLAKRHLLWGEPLLAEDAHRLGVVTDMVDDPVGVRPVALALARRVAALPPMAVQLTKRTFNKALDARTAAVLDVGFYLEMIAAGSEDLLEAVAAFKEQRPGKWVGR
jgi:enoyl-CoA hydratase